jgi:thiamine-phosphate pyrophosphorylase
MACDDPRARFEATDLYVVITGAFCNGRDPVDVLEDVLSAGVKLIQFREKDLTGTQLYELGSAFRERTAEADALLIVNDRIDIALAIEADGVHLGQSDLPVDVAKDIAPDLIVGASTHNLQEALGAQAAGAAYVNIGPSSPPSPRRTTSKRPPLNCEDWLWTILLCLNLEKVSLPS